MSYQPRQITTTASLPPRSVTPPARDARIILMPRPLVVEARPRALAVPSRAELQAILRTPVVAEAAPTKHTPAERHGVLALLIAAHNEEMVIESTLRSALQAGLDRRDIYVVDDNSSDATSRIARSILPKKNVIKVGRSGKGLALMKGRNRFNLCQRYQWIHIADADGVFDPQYFTTLREQVDPESAAATGYIKSLPGGIISQCRAYEYGMGMELMRRFQSAFGVIPIIPGATSCFRADVFAQIDFNSGSMTEDFDVTVQIHRQKLGKIQFIPEAIALTQDPKDLSDYIKQVNRWNRGFMQVMRHHRLGIGLSGIDAYMAYQLFLAAFYILSTFVWLPYIMILTQDWATLAIIFLADVIFAAGMAIAIAGWTKRYDILAAFPFIYAMRWLNMALFVKAIFEVLVLRRYKTSSGVWDTAGRRYKIAA